MYFISHVLTKTVNDISLFLIDFLILISRCADGFMGQRCEFKDLDGTYLRKYVIFVFFLFI